MADNRTEKPTIRHRREAEKRGQILRGRDLVSGLTLMAVILVIASNPQEWILRWRGFFFRAMQFGAEADWSGSFAIVGWTSLTVAQWLAPIFAVAFAVAVVSTVAQGGLVIASEALTINFARLNPATNIQQLFSLAVLSRLLKSLVPSGIILYLALRIILNGAPTLMHSSRLPARGMLALMGTMAYSLAWQSTLVLIAWSGVDYLLQRQTHESSLKMTKQQVKQESKDDEGSPQMKMRIRRLRRDRARRSLQQDVQRATAVIVNPVHFAVAIEYRSPAMAAPIVVAKGQNLIARRIKEIARWNNVPIVENPPLAQALYKSVEVGQAIPPKLYAAVAEILAFLYRAQMTMQRNAAAASTNPPPRQQGTH